MRITPYINFDGRCDAAFRFYAQCLGGTLEVMMTHGESPIADQVPPEWRDRILHARLAVNGALLMGGDAPPGQHVPERSTHLSLGVDTPAEADRIFAALSEGGTVTMPIQQTFWASRFGMLVDRFGMPWMVNCDLAD